MNQTLPLVSRVDMLLRLHAIARLGSASRRILEARLILATAYLARQNAGAR